MGISGDVRASAFSQILAFNSTKIPSVTMTDLGHSHLLNKILALAGLTRARQCTGNNFAKDE